MPVIQPFRALRYNPDVVRDLGSVLAPPYDVISPEEQERLHQRSPYNVVRLTLGRSSPSDTDAENRYTRSQREFAAWRDRRVLRADPAPAIYLTEQRFGNDGSTRSRLGFIALLELDDAVERAVYRHEATLEAPKHDRTRLLEAVPANLEPIFCVVQDAQGELQALVQALTAEAAPTAQAAFQEETVRVWALTQPRAIQELARRLASSSVLIADGHHRFEVALAHRHRYGALMTYFVSTADPSLVVRPIHRIVQYEGKADLSALGEACTLEPAATLDSLMRWLEAGDDGRFGYYDGQALARVTLRAEPLARWLMAPPVPLAVAALEVSLLHGLLLPLLLPNGRPRCAYTAEASAALAAVERGDGRAAWLLRAIPLAQVFALAAQGLALPPKSTYFYPKVPSGLTINPLN